MESPRASILWTLFAFLTLRVDGFYVPGVRPRSFAQGDWVPLRVNALTSFHTQVSKPYYDLPFCSLDGGTSLKRQNLGQFLTGNRIESSPYQLQMKDDAYCQILCSKRISNADYEVLSTHIRYNYSNNWIVDNLPSARVGISLNSGERQRHFAGGFPIGFLDPMSKTPYLYNHVNIYLHYHEVTVDPGRYRIVGFDVEPLSVKHEVGKETKRKGGGSGRGSRRGSRRGLASASEYTPTTTKRYSSSGRGSDSDSDSEDKTTTTTITTKPCTQGQHMQRDHILESQKVSVGETITFTYDVIWKPSNITWASRWDVYLSEDNLVPDEVHWYSIANAILLALVLAAMVVTVLVRHLRKEDYSLVDTNNTDSANSEDEIPDKDSDVPQSYPMLLSMCVGSGIQLFLCSLVITILSALGLLNPSRRGHSVQSFLLSYLFSAILNGYISSRLYKGFGGEKRNLCTFASAFGVSGVSFLLFLVLNAMSVVYGSVATPNSIVAVLAVMWCLSAVMVFVGAHIGFKKDAMNIPSISRVDAKGKHPPLLNLSRSKIVTLLIIAAVLVIILMQFEAWREYSFGLALIAVVILVATCATLGRLPWWVRIVSAGALPFFVIYVELFFIMTNMWMSQYYYVFEYTLMVYIALVVVVAEITILLVYNEVCSGTSRVWWLAFLVGASPGLYTFIYSIVWFRNLEPADMIITYATYFGCMSVFCGSLVLVTGSVAFVASLCFVRTIAGAQTEQQIDGVV